MLVRIAFVGQGSQSYPVVAPSGKKVTHVRVMRKEDGHYLVVTVRDIEPPAAEPKPTCFEICVAGDPSWIHEDTTVQLDD